MADRSSSKRTRARATQQAVVRLQRSVHRLMQAEVRSYTGGRAPALDRYYREYMREFRRHHAIASFGDLHQSMLESDLFFVGDYHTLRQSQELACRLLARAAAEERPLVLALEMILCEHQVHIDDYMRGDLDDRTFLERVDYHRTWNFDWANYKPLFEAARQHGVRVVGINHPAPPGRTRLRARDDAIAASLVEVVQAAPDARVMVLIGDLHLASNHLPRALEARLNARGTPRCTLIVYQNSDALYWSLAEKGAGADAQVVRLGDDRFCVMEVPPHVKLQSYLSWEQALERLEDVGDGDDFVVETTHTGILDALLRRLCQFFAFPPVRGVSEVFTNLDELFFEAVENAASVGEDRVREVHLLSFANRSCFIPELDIVYLPYFSVHHASEEAMHVLQQRVQGNVRYVDDTFEDFYARVWDSAAGFFASKLVNPLRAAPSETELRDFLRTASRRLHEPDLAFRKRVARFVLQHKDHERARLAGSRGRLKQIYEQELDVRLEVATTLGYMLGLQLADALQRGALETSDVRTLLFTHGDSPPSGRYFHLLSRLLGPRAGTVRRRAASA